MTKKRIEESQLHLQLKSTLTSNSGICMVRKRGHAAGAGITCGGKEKRAPANPLILKEWRRGWDSNPRYGSPYARFRGEYFQPLSHLSAATCDCSRGRA